MFLAGERRIDVILLVITQTTILILLLYMVAQELQLKTVRIRMSHLVALRTFNTHL